jgi:hypothetical protein
MEKEKTKYILDQALISSAVASLNKFSDDGTFVEKD